MRSGSSYSSTIERDCLYEFEYDPAVQRYRAQPFTITGTTPDGHAHRYTPDYLVIRHDGREIVECKPAARLDAPHTQQQIALGTTWAAENGHDFRVVTDTELRGPRLDNLKLLYRFAQLTPPSPQIQRCLMLLRSYPDGVAMRVLADQWEGGVAVLFPLLCHLLFIQLLTTTLQLPIRSNTVVRVVH